jgi:hypothetical protein
MINYNHTEPRQTLVGNVPGTVHSTEITRESFSFVTVPPNFRYGLRGNEANRSRQ